MLFSLVIDDFVLDPVIQVGNFGEGIRIAKSASATNRWNSIWCGYLFSFEGNIHDWKTYGTPKLTTPTTLLPWTSGPPESPLQAPSPTRVSVQMWLSSTLRPPKIFLHRSVETALNLICCKSCGIAPPAYEMNEHWFQ